MLKNRIGKEKHIIIGCILMPISIVLIQSILLAVLEFSKLRNQWELTKEFITHNFSEGNFIPLSDTERIRNIDLVYNRRALKKGYDEYGRVKTERDPSKKYTKFHIAFGGSFTEGHLVSETETVSHMVELQTKNTRSYNYGVGGAGPIQALAKLSKQELRNEVTETEGLITLGLTTSATGRIHGTPINIDRLERMPFYTQVNGINGFKGDIKNSSPWRWYFYRMIGYSLFRHLIHEHKNDLNVFFKSETKLVCSVIEKVKSLSLEQFPKAKFATLHFDNLSRELMRCLEGKNIDRIVIDRPFEQYPDGHPTSLGNRSIAKLIIERSSILQ